ncbi:MAG TPA: DUF6484 domain-containing protein [Enhygromyxa sp.]|nr:DUF6484 domain-containing protein [Enhygromyxa sp.]
MPDGSATRPDPLHVDASVASPRQPCLGRIVEVDAAGRPRVSFVDRSGPPPIARTIGEVTRAQLEAACAEGRPILLGFLDGRADAPVIMSLASMADLPAAPAPVEAEVRAEVVVDGEASVHVVEAREELLLRCGDATISLRADGTIKILGRDVTSWARRRQRIRGGSVAIN